METGGRFQKIILLRETEKAGAFFMNLQTGFFLVVLVAINGCGTPKETAVTPLPNANNSYAAGQEAATKDVNDGILAIETYGLPVPCYAEYEKLLKQKYLIELRPIAGCVVDDYILNHAKGYNEISNVEIKRRFGKDVWDKTMQEAQKLYENGQK